MDDELMGDTTPDNREDGNQVASVEAFTDLLNGIVAELNELRGNADGAEELLDELRGGIDERQREITRRYSDKAKQLRAELDEQLRQVKDEKDAELAALQSEFDGQVENASADVNEQRIRYNDALRKAAKNEGVSKKLLAQFGHSSYRGVRRNRDESDD